MNRNSIFLVFVVVLGLTFSLGCSDSDDNAETSVESENIQTGESQAVQEEEPAPASTEETPVSDDIEESKTVTLQEAKETEEEIPEEDDNEPEVDMETRMKQIEEEEAEEEEAEEEVEEENEKEVEESSLTISSEDVIWINVMTDDTVDVQADMEDVSRAATNSDIPSLSVYCDNLFSSTQTAIDHCDKYDVSADLQPVEDEYRLAMVAYNWAAVSCYSGIESAKAGNAATATANFDDGVKFINSGTDHISKANNLMNEYNKNHGI